MTWYESKEVISGENILNNKTTKNDKESKWNNKQKIKIYIFAETKYNICTHTRNQLERKQIEMLP